MPKLVINDKSGKKNTSMNFFLDDKVIKFKENKKYMGEMQGEYSVWREEYVDKLKEINDKYKSKDKKFYEENIKKFKALGY